MTVLECSTKLWQYFTKNDVLLLDNDQRLKDLEILSLENKDCDFAAVKAALEEFITLGLIKKSEVNGKTYYVLSKSLGAYEQTVTIVPELATNIASILNKFCDIIQDNTDCCDPARITARDIMNLYLIAAHCMEKMQDKEE